MKNSIMLALCLICVLTISGCTDDYARLGKHNFTDKNVYFYGWDNMISYFEDAEYNYREYNLDVFMDSEYVDWYFDNLPSWISIDPDNSIVSSTRSLSVKISENPDISSRTADFIFSHNILGKEEIIPLKVTQSGAPPNLAWENGGTDLSYTVSNKHQTFSAKLKTNLTDIKVSVSNSLCTAIYNNTKQLLYVTIPENTDLERRQCTITLKSSQINTVLRLVITQDEAYYIIFEDDFDSVWVNHMEQSITVKVNTNLTDIVAYPNDSMDFEPRYWDSVLYIFFSENTSNEHKEYEITLTSEKTAYSKKFHVFQARSWNGYDGVINGYRYVDLGLSVKWALYNMGASSVTEAGTRYAWGETSTKDSFTEDNCKTLNMNLDEFSGNSTYDAATANMGSSWRMPTADEYRELKRKCNFTWTEINGVSGYWIIGENHNSIFLPAAGYMVGSSTYFTTGGYYWTSSPVSEEEGITNGCGYWFDDSYNWCAIMERYRGCSIRPVTD